MKKRKVAFVTPIYLPANLYGSDNAVRMMAEELVQSGFDVSIITSNAKTPRYWYDAIWGERIDSKKEIIHGVKIYRLPCHQLFSSVMFVLSRYAGVLSPRWLRDVLQIIASGPYLVGLSQLLVTEQFGLVHVSPFPLGINKQVVDAVASMPRKPKIVLTPFFHSHVSTYHNQQLAAIVRKADVIHTVSGVEKREIEGEFPDSLGKTQVIPLFLRLSDIHTHLSLKSEINRLRVAYRLDNRIVVLFAGLKGTMKGALTLLSAMQILYKMDPRYVLVAIGHNTREWNAAIKTIDPGSLVDLSYVDERTKETIFAAADIFCMPSKSESFGLVYLEAWHKRKPVIAADIPAVRELIGNAGLFVPYKNIKKLVAVIQKLGYNGPLRTKLGNVGHERLYTVFNSVILLPQYRKLFR